MSLHKFLVLLASTYYCVGLCGALWAVTKVRLGKPTLFDVITAVTLFWFIGPFLVACREDFKKIGMEGL